METTRQSRIVIQDLPVEQPLTEAEMAALLGAGRNFRPQLETFEDRLVPSTLNVTSTLDNGAAGTLRYEVNQANADAARGVSDTILFKCGAFITLTQGPVELKAGSALIGIGGNTSSDEIILSKSGGIFQVDSRANVIMEDISMANASAYSGGAILNNGSLTVFDCGFSGDSASYGGAIYNNGGMTATGCSFTQDHATSGGAIYNNGNMTVNSSTLNANYAGYGGAIYNAASLTVNGNSNFVGNSDTYSGGAIDNNGTANVTASTFYSNDAGLDGGAIINFKTLTVSNTTFDYNHANDYGGAIYNVHGCYFSWSGVSWSGNSAGISNGGPNYYLA